MRLEELKEEWESKSGGPVKIDSTGEHAKKTPEKIASELAAIKKRNEARRKEGKKADPKDVEKQDELLFAQRAKGGWKKGKGATKK